MGTITTGIGLISGIDTATLIQQLLAIEARPKFVLEERITILQAQQTALLDINARLLNLKSTAAGFRGNAIFSSTKVTSSNEDVLSLVTEKNAPLGTFNFIVKQRVGSSQKLTKGFTDPHTAPMGLDQLSFEFGQGVLTSDSELTDLNGGAGVKRGKMTITDRSGNSATIDLTDVTTLNEVLSRINDDTSIEVTASIDSTNGDRLILTDDTGATTNNLKVENFGSSTVATDLGLVGDVAANSITGTTINTIGGATALRSLNDGNGVLIVNNSPDFVITARDGAVFSIDLGRVNTPIDNATKLSELNNGLGVAITNDATDFQFVAADGTVVDVNLGDIKDGNGVVTDTAVTTVGELISRVHSQLEADATISAGDVVMAINADGTGFTMTDTRFGGAGFGIEPSIKGAGANGTKTARDLGFDPAAVTASSGLLTGSAVPNLVSTPRAATIQDVLDRINNAKDTGDTDNGGRVVASIAADGVSILITDTTGSTVSNLKIASTATNALAADQLGITADVAGTTVDGTRLISGMNTVLARNLNGGEGIFTLAGTTLLSSLNGGAGITTNGNGALADLRVQDRAGTIYDVEVDGLTTVQELVDAFNTATNGKVTLAISGTKLVATNRTAGASNFQIQNRNGATVAGDLGLVTDNNAAAGNVATGSDLNAVSSTIFSVTNRNGVVTNIDLTGVESLAGVMELINNAGAGVTAAVNNNGTGLAITDTTGGTGNLILGGNMASNLGVATATAGVSADSVTGSNLQLQYVSEASLLSDLNYGRGVGTGSFRITDGLGKSEVVSIGSDAITLNDIIAEINSRGLAMRARINDNGDGIVIEEDYEALGGTEAFVALKVESLSGSVAGDLNIIGAAKTITGGFVDGSYEQVVDLETTDSLDDVVKKINEAGVPVGAAVLNTGAGATPFHLNLTSEISGRAGEMIVDTGGVDMGFSTLSEGRDAKVFFGSVSPEDAFLITSSTNTIEDVLPDVTLTLHDVSTTAVEITIERDREAITEGVKQLATTFNDAIGRINQHDFFNVETEERGVLLGNGTVSQVRTALYRTLRSQARGVSTQFQFLSQVGMVVGSKGEVSFDQEKFDTAYDNDPQAVENLFAAFDSDTTVEEEIGPGITISKLDETVTVAGLGQLFEELMEGLTNSIDGTMKLADNNFDTQIEAIRSRIEIVDNRLEAKQVRLEAQFVAMEIALAQIQGQGQALAGFFGGF